MSAHARASEGNFWGESRERREAAPALSGDVTVDVAVIGARLHRARGRLSPEVAEPGLEVAILEAETAGYGASGRNAGFVMTLFGASVALMKSLHGKERVRAAHALHGRLDRRARSDDRRAWDRLRLRAQRLPAGGDRAEPTSPRIRKEMELFQALGIDGIEWLDARGDRGARALADVSRRLLGAGLRAARSREVGRCAAPARLRPGARGSTRARALRASRARAGAIRLTTARGTVTADKVVYATNGYTHLLPGMASKQMPAFAYIVVTEPLSAEQLAAIGWAGREGIEDGAQLHALLSPDARRPHARRRRPGPGAVRRPHEPRRLAQGVGASGALHRHDVSGAPGHPHRASLGRGLLRDVGFHPAGRHARTAAARSIRSAAPGTAWP